MRASWLLVLAACERAPVVQAAPRSPADARRVDAPASPADPPVVSMLGVVGERDRQGDARGLTRDEIDQVIKARVARIRDCYDERLDEAPGIAGMLELRFRIGADGAVAKVGITAQSTLHDATVEACVVAVFYDLVFPRGPANVTYPFVFSSGP